MKLLKGDAELKLLAETTAKCNGGIAKVLVQESEGILSISIYGVPEDDHKFSEAVMDGLVIHSDPKSRQIEAEQVECYG